MTRRYSASIAVSFLVMFAVPAHADWQTVAPPDGRYSVSFPDAPKTTDMNTVQFQSHSFVLSQSAQLLSAGYKDYVAGTKIDAQKELAASRDDFIAAMNATLMTSGDAALTRGPTPIPALLFTFKQGQAQCDSEIAVEGPRVYQILACRQIGASSDVTDRFMKSFTLPSN